MAGGVLPSLQVSGEASGGRPAVCAEGEAQGVQLLRSHREGTLGRPFSSREATGHPGLAWCKGAA